MRISNLIKILVLLSAALTSRIVFAGPPLTNLEGVGGIAFNPVAFPADSGDGEDIGKPRFGAWYINLDDVKVDWTVIGVADTFFKRLELSYGYETVNQAFAPERHKSNVGAKVLLLPENTGSDAVPAISAGTVYKHTTNTLSGLDKDGWDFYLVATKLIKETPLPVLVSAGAISSKAYTTGVFGYGEDSKVTGFGNVDVVFPVGLIAGFEYKQGPKFDGWHDSDYWDAHLAWTPTNNLTLVAAYVDAGNENSTSQVGLGNGYVLSTQYAF